MAYYGPMLGQVLTLVERIAVALERTAVALERLATAHETDQGVDDGR